MPFGGMRFVVEAILIMACNANWVRSPATATMMKQRTPYCPFHSNPMTPTKIFGDWVNSEEETVTLQWKCPTCVLTHHRTLERTYPHGDVDPFTDKEKQIIKERLRNLGYIE